MEQPFFGFDEWPRILNPVIAVTSRDDWDKSIAQAEREFEVPRRCTLYECFCFKYGWHPGRTRIWVNRSQQFLGWKVTRLEIDLASSG